MFLQSVSSSTLCAVVVATTIICLTMFQRSFDSFFLHFQEAKNAFKELLESVRVESDWTWEQVCPFTLNLLIFIEFRLGGHYLNHS